MGSSASTLGESMKDVRLAFDQLPATLIDILGHDLDRLLATDDDQKVTIAELVHACQGHTDVFLSHDWGKNQTNHRHVARINQALKGKRERERERERERFHSLRIFSPKYLFYLKMMI
jgi:predicted metallopeptidase